MGTAKDMTLHLRARAPPLIHAYKFTNNNTTLELLHKRRWSTCRTTPNPNPNPNPTQTLTLPP